MDSFKGFVKSIIEELAVGAGVVLAAPVAIAGEVFDSETLKEAGQGIYKATATTGVIVGQGLSGGADVVEGFISGDYNQRDKGLSEIGNAINTTINGVYNGIKTVAQSGFKVVEGVINNDNDQIEHGASTLLKAAIIAPFAISIADGLDIIDINGNEAPVVTPVDDIMPITEPTGVTAESPMGNLLDVKTAEAAEIHTQEMPVEQDDSVLTENGDLVPEKPVDQIPGVHNGMADPSATDDLIRLGCREDAYHVPDPDRDPAARDEFLRQHGYDECPTDYEVHHVVPLYAGGADVPENMVLVSVEEHDRITAEQKHYYQDKFNI